MGENTNIQWCDSTFNAWRGCTKVSAGCANCYAEKQAKPYPKTLGIWGKDGTRVVASDAMWKDPLKWDRAAKAAGERHRVFCASMADVFEDWKGSVIDSKGNPLHFAGRTFDGMPMFSATGGQGTRPATLDDIRERLFRIIDATPNLDWLLLTKRPENIARMMPPMDPQQCFFCKKPASCHGTYEGHTGYACDTCCGHGCEDGWCEPVGSVRPNVWIGVSVEDQKTADERIPELLKFPAAVRFVSYEPALGPMDLMKVPAADVPRQRPNGIDWIIVGGESGPKARPFDVAWARSIVAQCKAASELLKKSDGIACFVKQLGAKPYQKCSGCTCVGMEIRYNRRNSSFIGCDSAMTLRDPKGGDMSEWPQDIRVREIPKANQ